MSYQTSKSVSHGIPGDLVVVASCAMALSLFVAGYSATRLTLGQVSIPASNTELKDIEVNVVGHEGTLWDVVGQPIQ